MEARDPEMSTARWMRFEDWRHGEAKRPALLLDARVTPEPGAAGRLLDALAAPGVDAATSYFFREDEPGSPPVVVAPLGPSLEIGWRHNGFGGACLAANPSAFNVLAGAVVDDAFAFWPAYAAIACSGMELAVVPTPLYTTPADALQVRGHAELEAVLARFRSPAALTTLDVAWALKSAFAAMPEADGLSVQAVDSPVRPAHVGRTLYDRLLRMPNNLLTAYAGLDVDVEEDPFLRDFARIRERLAPIVAAWRESDPRVFIYGTGQHTKMLLALCPELGRFVAGFIDRRPAARFLGKPCVAPDGFRSDMADAVVYSSREFERDMYARLKDARVEHVLLYGDSPDAPSASTATRLRNRFGHDEANAAGLEAMYAPPAWATGYISGGDAEFLLEMVAAHQPRTVLELGVASGASSAALLFALDQLPDAEGRVLRSCDVRRTCYFNEAYETGQACREMYPVSRARWHRDFSTDARRIVRALPSGSVDLTFIDANHCHPGPLLDLLHLTAVARPGSWVVLHDIRLPIQHPEYQVFGPRWLFQAWPFNKVATGGQWVSIGAVQLPDDPAQLAAMALSLLQKPWEATPRLTDIDLPPAFAAIQDAVAARTTRTDGILVSA
jgi:predicted O-methyltransferase YrrM